MKFVSQLLGRHFARYPRMQLEDVYKLLHQAAMGSGHAVDDEAAVRRRLDEEIAALGDGPEEPARDLISPDAKLARIHLRGFLASGGDPAELHRAFVATARGYPAAPDKLVKFCGCLGELAGAGGIPFAQQDVVRYFDEIARAGYPVVHHSRAFREAYKPAYRVVSLDYLAAQ